MSASTFIRVISAMVLAAAAAATLSGILVLSAQIVPIALIFALPHAALGLVVYFLLRLRWKFTLQSSLIAGFLIGAIPMSIMIGVATLPDSASSDGVSTVIDGHLTLAGYYERLILAASFGLFGAVAGLVFWLIIRSSPQAMASQTGSTNSARSHFALPLTFVVASVVVIFLIPSFIMDRTCHNSLRDGGTSIGSEIGINLRIRL